jgi:selenoprotein W-related protein
VLGGWGSVLRQVEVVPGVGGVFDVEVDGRMVFTKKMLGRYPDPEDVLPLLREALGPEPGRGVGG